MVHEPPRSEPASATTRRSRSARTARFDVEAAPPRVQRDRPPPRGVAHDLRHASHGEPVQVVHPPPSFDLPLIDLSHLSREQAERQAVRLVAEVSRVPYDLRRGPLLRPRLIRFPGEHHRLYLAMHHLIFDGVSVYRVVLPELVALYDAFSAGARRRSPEPEVTYADYARWEQEWIGRAAGRAAAGALADASTSAAPGPLAPARPPAAGDPALPRRRGRADGSRRTSVDRLREIGQGAGATLFQVLAGTLVAAAQPLLGPGRRRLRHRRGPAPATRVRVGRRLLPDAARAAGST